MSPAPLSAQVQAQAQATQMPKYQTRLQTKLQEEKRKQEDTNESSVTEDVVHILVAPAVAPSVAPAVAPIAVSVAVPVKPAVGPAVMPAKTLPIFADCPNATTANRFKQFWKLFTCKDEASAVSLTIETFRDVAKIKDYDTFVQKVSNLELIIHVNCMIAHMNVAIRAYTGSPISEKHITTIEQFAEDIKYVKAHLTTCNCYSKWSYQQTLNAIEHLDFLYSKYEEYKSTMTKATIV